MYVVLPKLNNTAADDQFYHVHLQRLQYYDSYVERGKAGNDNALRIMNGLKLFLKEEVSFIITISNVISSSVTGIFEAPSYPTIGK